MRHAEGSGKCALGSTYRILYIRGQVEAQTTQQEKLPLAASSFNNVKMFADRMYYYYCAARFGQD